MKKIHYWFLSACLLLSTTSCEDYLERFPLEGPADQSYFANASELELAVNGCYKGMTFAPSDGMPTQLLLDDCTDIGWDRNNSTCNKSAKEATTAITVSRGRSGQRPIKLLAAVISFWTT